MIPPSSTLIRATRLRAGLTQVQAAQLMDWTPGYWLQLEGGKRRLTGLQWTIWLHLAGIEPMPFTPR